MNTPKKKKSILIYFIALNLFMLIGINTNADVKSASMKLMMKSVKLVPDLDWTYNNQIISIHVNMDATSDDEQKFKSAFHEHLIIALDKLNVETENNSSTLFEIELDEFSQGVQWKKLVSGFWGRGKVYGTLKVIDSGETVGLFAFSSKLRGGITAGSVKAMAKEVAPPLMYKVIHGLKDSELHSKG